nr:hypothetical protein [Kibdelosporangium sp. MJ126-NF4]CTQ89899.1 hypothetical protein [Kibdelosporangium sp. MJ126-NF4]
MLRSSPSRAARPDGAPIHIILDNLSAHRGATIRTWAASQQGHTVLHSDLFLPADRTPQRVVPDGVATVGLPDTMQFVIARR